MGIFTTNFKHNGVDVGNIVAIQITGFRYNGVDIGFSLSIGHTITTNFRYNGVDIGDLIGPGYFDYLRYFKSMYTPDGYGVDSNFFYAIFSTNLTTDITFPFLSTTVRIAGIGGGGGGGQSKGGFFGAGGGGGGGGFLVLSQTTNKTTVHISVGYKGLASNFFTVSLLENTNYANIINGVYDVYGGVRYLNAACAGGTTEVTIYENDIRTFNATASGGYTNLFKGHINSSQQYVDDTAENYVNSNYVGPIKGGAGGIGTINFNVPQKTAETYNGSAGENVGLDYIDSRGGNGGDAGYSANNTLGFTINSNIDNIPINQNHLGGFGGNRGTYSAKSNGANATNGTYFGGGGGGSSTNDQNHPGNGAPGCVLLYFSLS